MAQPSYLALHETGELRSRAEEALRQLDSCSLCPRDCRVDRTAGERGFCDTADKARIWGSQAHFGEEAPLVGRCGSGTVFICGCNLGCTFCQNDDISRGGYGTELGPERLAAMMLSLQEGGCHNVNFVTPTHVVPQILDALTIAVERGLRVPLVYNCGGYESVDTIRLLEGVFEIYMPDFKFWDPKWSERFCGVRDYPQRARDAVVEMHRQVGDLHVEDGIAERGLLVRHLVMPNGAAGTAQVARFLAESVSADTYLNVMAQYRPCGDAATDSAAGRSVTRSEVAEAVRAAREAGLDRLD